MSEVLCPYCGDEMRHVATTWTDAEYYECKDCHSRSPSANCMKVKEAALTRKGSPVVRCNECKHYEADTGFCYYWDTGRDWDDFCSSGTKKVGGVSDG